MRIFQKVKKQHTTVIFFFLITAISLFLRIYRFDQRIWWFGDTARDILVSRHIIQFKELPLVGNCASSFFGGPFYYPPFYYYILAGLSVFFHTARDLMYAVTALESMFSGIMFLLGTVLFSPSVGIIAGMLFAISSYAISTATVWTAFAAPVFFYMGILFFEYSKKIHKPVLQYVGVALIILGGTIHLSIIICAAIYLVFKIMQEPTIRKRLLLSVYAVLCWLVFYIPLYISYGFTNVILRFVPKHGSFLSIFPVEKYLAVYGKIWNLFFDFNVPFSQYAIWILIITCLINYKNVYRFIKKVPYFLCMVIVLPLLGVMNADGDPDVYVYVGLFPIFILFYASLLGNQWSGFASIHKIASFICIIAMIYCLGNNFDHTFTYEDRHMQESREITTFIETDATMKHISPLFSVIAGGETQVYDWEGPMYWYFQESMYRKKVVRVVNIGENLELIDKQPAYVYLICRRYYERVANDCQNPFLRDHQEYFFLEEVTHPFGDEYKIFLYKRIGSS